MTYTPTNWVDGSTPLNRANMMKIENELAKLDSGSAAYGTSLPGSPSDGQIFFFVANVNGIVWQLRFNAASNFPAYPWEFVGGSALLGNDASSTLAGSTSYVDRGPSFVLPRAGDYELSYGCVIGASATGEGLMSPSATNMAAADYLAVQMASPATVYGQGSRTMQFAGLTGTLSLSYRNGSGAPSFTQRWITARPIRIG